MSWADEHFKKIREARSAILLDLEDRLKKQDPKVARNGSAFVRGESASIIYGQGELVCPCCSSGTLRYARSKSNGHIQAHCGTDGCVSWME